MGGGAKSRDQCLQGKRGRFGHRQTGKEAVCWQRQSREGHSSKAGTPGATRSKERQRTTPTEALEGTNSVDTLILDFWPLEL